MLSAQIDELRATAEEIDWEFPFTASRLREAANTIWQLCDDLQKANAENAKLRELVQDYHRYEHEDCYACRYINECRADESGRCIAPMRLGERYRELGVEVD